MVLLNYKHYNRRYPNGKKNKKTITVKTTVVKGYVKKRAKAKKQCFHGIWTYTGPLKAFGGLPALNKFAVQISWAHEINKLTISLRSIYLDVYTLTKKYNTIAKGRLQTRTPKRSIL